MNGGHKAKRWVEDHYPDVQGALKEKLILAYGAGLDEGLREAQEILAETAAELLIPPRNAK